MNELDKYKKEKLKILKRDFHIRITDADVEHMEALKTEIQVDNFVKEIINTRL